MQHNLAPIVLFVYNRPEHTLKTLQALKQNLLANESVLYIFSDGPKENASLEDLNKIRIVRNIIVKEKWCKEVNISERSENFGLANSIINGVSEIVKIHKKVIVLEDDIITSKWFLKYMNEGLLRYADNDEVFQITGYFPQSANNKAKGTSFFLPVTSTWGWGSWEEKWRQIDFMPTDIDILYNSDLKRKEFNLGNIYDYSGMLHSQMVSKNISSWGIRFYWHVFKSKKMILYPDQSLINNIGFDGTGIHCGNSGIEEASTIDLNYEIITFPDEVKVNLKEFKRYKRIIKKQTSGSVLNNVKRRLQRLIKKQP